jgi:23S rRNA-/tRNA-specific pseudouridylate synthase
MSRSLFRFIVSAPVSLERFLLEQGLEAALADGRLFVDGRRAAAGAAELPPGACVEVFAPRPSAEIEILASLEGVVAVSKPAELATEPDHSGHDCVLTRVAQQLGVAPDGLFAASRLDVGVSGVLLVATDTQSRKRLVDARLERRIERRYVALVCGSPKPAQGDWREPLGRARGGNRSTRGQAAEPAHTRYRLLATARAAAPHAPATALVALAPVTGRTHQLRAHAAEHALPMLGDRRYGGPTRVTASDGSVSSIDRVLLHALWVEWPSPRGCLRIVAEPAAALTDTWLALAGDAAAFQLALD